MSDPAERKFVDVFSDYQRALQRANAFDFDDLIGQTVYILQGTAGNIPLAAAFAVVPIAVMAVYLLAARRLGAFDAF